MALAYWIIQTLLLFLNVGRSAGETLDAAPDPLVICFAILLSLLTTFLFGLVPAWQSTKPALTRERTDALGGVALRRGLIVFQIALSLMILFAAGLMTRTLSRLKTVDLGFDPGRVIAFKVDPGMNGYTPERSNTMVDEILNRLRAEREIKAASFAMVSPLTGDVFSLDIQVPGRTAKTFDTQTLINIVTPQYSKTLNLALLAGRDFDEQDGLAGPHVVIVNQLFAEQYMPGLNPLGRHIKSSSGGDVEIVGVVKNSHYQELRESVRPLVYFPSKLMVSSGNTILVRTTLPQNRAMADIREVVRSIDPRVPIFEMQQLQDQIDRGLSSERVLTFFVFAV
jgi:hypothetical protein